MGEINNKHVEWEAGKGLREPIKALEVSRYLNACLNVMIINVLLQQYW